jgi:hypothetical protein
MIIKIIKIIKIKVMKDVILTDEVKNKIIKSQLDGILLINASTSGFKSIHITFAVNGEKLHKMSYSFPDPGFDNIEAYLVKKVNVLKAKIQNLFNEEIANRSENSCHQFFSLLF